MERNTVIVGAVMLLIGLGIGYALNGNSARIGHMPAPYGTEGSRSGMGDGSMMSQNIDQHFIVQMIPHHEGAIEMAKVALTRSKRPEIISLANGIIEAQTREINDMTGWYTAWFGGAPPEGGVGGMGGAGMTHMGGMTGDTDDLKTVAVADFDREFIDQMIPHHEMAIMMASMLQSSTDRAEMKTLADNITKSQSREIEMMRSWRASWYPQN